MAAQPPIQGSHFKDGVKLCLKNDGAENNTWAKNSVVAAQKNSGFVCDDGFVPCSEKADMTICVKPENYESECPVTDILVL